MVFAHDVADDIELGVSRCSGLTGLLLPRRCLAAMAINKESTPHADD